MTMASTSSAEVYCRKHVAVEACIAWHCMAWHGNVERRPATQQAQRHSTTRNRPTALRIRESQLPAYQRYESAGHEKRAYIPEPYKIRLSSPPE